jgi:hypothetical protein
MELQEKMPQLGILIRVGLDEDLMMLKKLVMILLDILLSLVIEELDKKLKRLLFSMDNWLRLWLKQELDIFVLFVAQLD